MNKWMHLLKLKFSKPYRESVIEQEYKNSKKHRYATFEQFLSDLPEYQLKTDLFNSLIRKIYGAAGVKFQQYVFIDKSSAEDSTAWIRRDKNKILHGKGTYLTPWKSNKNLIYYDVIDSRPLIDLTEEMDWRNQDMCADVVTAITNENNMNALRGQNDPYSKYTIIVLIVNVIIVILLAVLLYQIGDDSKKTTELLAQVLNQTKPLVTVIGK